ncbi:MAG: methylated-DNA--[protein]-cysteine S-methyltransferase [Deltaproteobacteria bacterium]|nr:methylated-DNA--[protein]-cysteine S-methyltransferase [Deltaproteobacteria bacterium]
MTYGYCDSPIGRLRLAGDDGGLRHLHLADAEPWEVPAGWREDRGAFDGLRRQLDEYFAGLRRHFDVRLVPQGTGFQQEVWRALRTIPFGCTETYAGLAARVGRPKAARAVGAANGANPIAILIPCHRVVGRGGRLTGYSGGLARKQALLDLEARAPGS